MELFFAGALKGLICLSPSNGLCEAFARRWQAGVCKPSADRKAASGNGVLPQGIIEPCGDRSNLAVADALAVYRHNRQHFRNGAG